METFLAILIIVPTAAVVLLGAAYVVGMFAASVVAGVDGVIVGIRHRLHRGVPSGGPTFGSPALHH